MKKCKVKLSLPPKANEKVVKRYLDVSYEGSAQSFEIGPEVVESEVVVPYGANVDVTLTDEDTEGDKAKEPIRFQMNIPFPQDFPEMSGNIALVSTEEVVEEAPAAEAPAAEAPAAEAPAQDQPSP